MTTKPEALAALDAVKTYIDSTGGLPPPSGNFQISGTVYDGAIDGPAILAGVTINAPGCTPPTQQTNSTGSYTLNAPAGLTFDITPSDGGAHAFQPALRHFSNIAMGASLQSFGSTAAAGQPPGPGPAGVSLIASNPPPTGTLKDNQGRVWGFGEYRDARLGGTVLRDGRGIAAAKVIELRAGVIYLDGTAQP